MKLLKTLAFVCLCVPMWGQGYRYDSNAFTSANNVPPGSQSTMFTIPFAKITVCAYPDNGGQPCTNTVPIYQDPALTVTAQNPITADVHGRFGFWKAAGTYTFSVVSPDGTFLGTFVFSLGGAGSSGGGCSTGGIPTTNGSVTGDTSSTNCGYNNRTGDTAGADAQNQTFGANLLDTNSGTDNVAMGIWAGDSNTGSINVFIGDSAGQNNTSTASVMIGSSAGFDNEGGNVVAIGQNSGSANAFTSGNNNFARFSTFIGTNAGLQDATPSATATGNYLDCVGYDSCTNLQTNDDYIVGIGAFTADGNSGGDIVGIGNASGVGHSGHNIIGIGDGSGDGSNGNTQVAGDNIIGIGNGSGSGTGSEVISIGEHSGARNTGNSNAIAVGNHSLGGLGGFDAVNGPIGAPVTGNELVAVGDHALIANTSGSDNVAIGRYAGSDGWVLAPTGSGGTLGNANLTGSNNTWIGDFSGPNTTTQLSNTIALGYQAFNTASNQTTIGNASITSLQIFGCPSGQTAFDDGSGTCYTPGAGAGTITGSGTTGYVPLWTGTTAIGNSHLDDGISTAGTITSSEPIAVTGPPGVIMAHGTATGGVAGAVVYAVDPSVGYAEVNENNTGLSRVCTAANGICAGGSPFITSLTTTGSSGAATVSSGVLNVPVYSGSGTSNPYTCTVQSTNLKCLGIAPYSATTGGDNSALLQQAITDLSSVGGGDIYVPCGVYPLTGSLQDPTGANAIVQMPKIIAYSGTPIGIHIHGCAVPAQSGLTTGVTVFSTTETTGNIFGGYEATSGGFGPLTNVYLSFENIVIRQPPNPQMAAINATNIVGLRLDHVWCDVSGTPVTPTNTTGACVLAPTIANSAFVQLYDVTAVNTYTGFILGEHTTFDGLYGSVLHDGFIFESAATLVGHANSVHGGYAWCQLCVNQVVSGGLNPIALNISNMDLESTSGNGILDTGNLLYGTLNYHVPAASGAVTPANPNVSGAANLHYHNLDFPGVAVSADAATNGGGGTNATWNWYAGTSTPHISWSNPTPGNLTWTSSVSSGAGLFVNNSSTNANAYSYLGECNGMTHCTLTANIPATSGLPAIYPKDGLYQASNSVMAGGSTYNTEGAYPLKLATNNTVRFALDGAGAGAFTLATHTSLTENGEVVCTASNSACSGTIASGTSALGTSAISSGTCATVVTTTATGTATTDVVGWGFNADPTSTTGYSPTTNGMLTIIAYPTANAVNFKTCNNTSASVTPGAVTLNWRVAR